jgi:murein DD-endopeptidase MepM/ murein hydrolase activator NlpD
VSALAVALSSLSSAPTTPVPTRLTATPPLSPLTVTRGFDPPATPYGPGHRGVDLAGAPGEEVHSALSGAVTFTGLVAGTAVVEVATAGGRRLTYEPVEPEVRAGELVIQGQALGHLEAGHPGCPVAACLHWGLIVDGSYADPLELLAADQVRLLPWSGEPDDLSGVGPGV